MGEKYTTRKRMEGSWFCDGPQITWGFYASESIPRNYNQFENEEDAKKAARLMNEAFEAGRQDAKREIRKAIGL